MNPLYHNKWALVTGASSGIGETFALKLAAMGANIVLVARNQDKLNKTAKMLENDFHIKTKVLVCDLSDINAPQALYDQLKNESIHIDILVNNAGIGINGRLHTTSFEKTQAMLALNVIALSSLTQLFITNMQAAKAGIIFNIASTAAFQPLPYMANYAASKAFVLSFSEAIAAEYKPYGIKVLAVCPGGTQTNFFTAMEGSSVAFKMDTVETVVNQSLKAMQKGRNTIICGNWSNYILAQLSRFLPRSAVLYLSERIMLNAFK